MKKFEDLCKEVIAFNKKRGWDPVPADCAKSVIIEGAELLEQFQWDETDQGRDFVKEKDWQEIGLEVADVLWYLITFCKKADLDINDCLERKLQHNGEKYTEMEFHGKHNEAFYRQQKRKYRQSRIK
ncbi:MAG: MazG-like family protein [Patescibacteria group bacterium]|jgi:NTP pyrophosphatase (non-canonical NTP hydrolase)